MRFWWSCLDNASILAIRMNRLAQCGRQSCLQAAFQAAVQLTTHSVRNVFLRLRLSQVPRSLA